MKQIIQIACKIGVDLEEGRKVSKEKWKKRVDEKIYKYVKKYSEEEVRKLKKYKEIMKDEIEPGVQKKYMSLTVKKAASIFRARTDTIDTKPRKPYWEKSQMKCKFCNEKKQSSRHYIVECIETERYFENKMNREEVWRIVEKLEASQEDLKQTATIIQRIIKEINK